MRPGAPRPNSQCTTSLITGIVYKAASRGRWRALREPAAGFQGARRSSPAVRGRGVPPDNADDLIECHMIVSCHRFLRKI